MSSTSHIFHLKTFLPERTAGNLFTQIWAFGRYLLNNNEPSGARLCAGEMCVGISQGWLSVVKCGLSSGNQSF